VFRHVDRPGTILPSPVYDHVPFRKGPVVAPLPWRARTSQVSKWRRTMHWCEDGLLCIAMMTDVFV
jgi:hypothetical protein